MQEFKMPYATLGRIPNGTTGAANNKNRLWVPKWFLSGGTAPNADANVAAPIATAPAVISASSLSVAGGGVASILVPTQWANSPSSVTNQWTRDGANISGATSTTYAFVAADVGHLIGLAQVATNATGTGNGTSNSLGPIVA
jgi:hypothetical protein